MLETPEIRLLLGFGPLTFGETPDIITPLLGSPEQTQELREEILNTHTLVYHYPSKGLSLFFDCNKHNKFYQVETSNKNTVLFNELLFNQNEKTLTELMKKHAYVLSETEQHPWGEKRLGFDEAGLDCYFENHRLVIATISHILPIK